MKVEILVRSLHVAFFEAISSHSCLPFGCFDEQHDVDIEKRFFLLRLGVCSVLMLEILFGNV